MDTDHLSLYERAHPKLCARIIRTRQQSSDTLFTTVVSLEEQYAGRIAQIRKATTPQALVEAYSALQLHEVHPSPTLPEVAGRVRDSAGGVFPYLMNLKSAVCK